MAGLAGCSDLAQRSHRTLIANESTPGAKSKNQHSEVLPPRPLKFLRNSASSFGFMSEATVLLAAVEQGDSKAAAELLELVYDELRHLASAKMAQQTPGQTLQPTALVHEAWLRLVGAKNPTFKNSTHFFAAAAEAMREFGYVPVWVPEPRVIHPRPPMQTKERYF